MPPKGTVQRRLTRTADRKYPGVQGPRHWVRSSPIGAWIAFLAKDDDGVVQIHLVSPNGGPVRQLTRNKWPVRTAFNWSPDGRRIAYGMDNSIFITDLKDGSTVRVTEKSSDEDCPCPYSVCWSNDGKMVACNRNVEGRPQIFVLKLN